MTAPMLESYVAGGWFAAADDGAPVADAVTGETVVRVSSTGLDVPAMLDHARTVGGPALRVASLATMVYARAERPARPPLQLEIQLQRVDQDRAQHDQSAIDRR